MNYLIICTYFIPDTAIAAKRPYFFAKYLSEAGNNVTVLYPGFVSILEDSTYSIPANVKTIRYLPKSFYDNKKENRFTRGISWRLKKYLPNTTKLLKKIYSTNLRLKYLKKTINLLKSEDYDIIFSTYGDCENIAAGIYAKKKLNRRLIMDLRDPICRYDTNTFQENIYLRYWEKRILNSADCLTVTTDGIKEMYTNRTSLPIHVLRNGFDSEYTYPEQIPQDGLNVVYTGKIYGKELEAITELISVIQKMLKDGKISKKDITLHIAGDSFTKLKYIPDINEFVVNHGVLERKDIYRLQVNSDIFLVLSWNTEKEKGVIPGKFYESIPFKKNVLALIGGNVKESELYQLNEKYHYGYCYECANNSQKSLQNYLLEKLKEKKTYGNIKYEGSRELLSCFNYHTLTEELLKIAEEQLTTNH